MKRLFTLFCFILCVVINTKASDPIDFVHHPKNEQGQGNRGSTLLPTADYDDNVINLYVPYDIEDMQVVIKDVQGEVIYSSMIPYVVVQHSIVLSNGESAEKYSIELFFNGWHLIGFF